MGLPCGFKAFRKMKSEGVEALRRVKNLKPIGIKKAPQGCFYICLKKELIPSFHPVCRLPGKHL